MSAKPILGAYAAKDCPLKVQYDKTDAKEGVEPLPQSAFSEMLTSAGIAFEAEVFAAIAAAVEGVVDLSASDAEIGVLAVATVAAMDAGAPVILGGALPLDQAGRRTGKPDVLVRAEPRNGIWRYLPVDVKHHSARKVPSKPDDKSVYQSSLDAPAFKDRVQAPGFELGSHRHDDLLQLAHYRRMLEAAGYESEHVVGGIIGREQVIVWADLNVAMFKQTWVLTNAARRSALETYDFEFAFRLDVTDRWNSTEELLAPIKTGQCDVCPWWSACGPTLSESDSTSLLPGVGYVPWKILDKAGIRSRADLAALDPTLAELRDTMGKDLLEWFHVTGELAPDTAVSKVTGPGHTDPWWQDRAALLTKAGIHSVEELHAKMRLYADMTGTATGEPGKKPAVTGWGSGVGNNLTTTIYQARVAALGTPGTPYRRPGLGSVTLPDPGFDVDIDMENTHEAVYLWGALTPDGTYQPIVNWDPDPTAATADVFVRFWDWATKLLNEVHTAAEPVRFWGWNLAAEKTALLDGNLAAVELGHPDRTDAIKDLVKSDHWVDLKTIFDNHLLTGTGTGLKAVAPLAGHDWEDDDAGGDNSMIWYAQAINPAPATDQDTSRTRLLTYNKGDVRATAAIRHWVRTTTFPNVTELGA